MDDKKPLLSVKSDYIFKLIFGDQRNVDILAAFLRSVLDIPESEYDHLTIIDPHIKKESKDDKYGVLDVKLHTTNGSIIHIEIQLRVHSDMKARTVYSQSKLITEQMSAGGKWSDIKRSITIVITDEVFVPEGERYHHEFRYRTRDGLEFTDLTEINTLDLNTLPIEDDSTDLWYWMKFIKTDDEEVLDMLATRTPQMRKAVGVLKRLSADEQTRMLYEAHEMARRDAEYLAEDERKKREKLESVVAEKDTAIAEKDTAIAEQAAAIEKQAAEIERLRAELEKSKNNK